LASEQREDGAGRLQPGQRRQHARHQHADHRGRLAPGDDAGAPGLVTAEPGAPGLVHHGDRAVGQVGEREHDRAPPQQRARAFDQREEQRLESHGQQHGGGAGDQQGPAGRAREQPVDQTADQRVGDRVEQPCAEQHGAEQCQRHAEPVGVVVRQHHVERQRDEGQRHAQQAVAQPGARTEGRHRGAPRPG
jgi:hypothetical protein